MASSSYHSRKVLRSSENFPVASGYDRHHKSPSRSAAAAAISPDASAQPPRVEDAPEPPQPPRSAFMCFTDAKKREIMDKRGIVEENDDILNIVAEEWKNLSDKDRAHWDEECRNDKVRYVRAKAAYKGPTLIPKRRAKKHPMAPKRPMSAFLKFSQTRRQRVKKENPDMSNTDVSRLLGEMWRNASPKEKVPYREQEERERAHYKEEIKKFKDEQARADAASRTSHQSVHGYRHYPHPAEDYYHQRSFASQPPITNTFDTLRMDSFEEPVPSSNSGLKPGPFRPLHGHVYPPYRQTYSSATEPVSLHHGGDIHDDLLQVVPHTSRAPLPGMDEEDSIAAHYNGRSSSYFQESNVEYFSRYP